MVQWLDRSSSQPPAVSRCNSGLAKGERGFTLVEVLISMVIMAVGLVAVAQLLAVSTQTHRIGRVTSESSILAAVKIEELAKLSLATHPSLQITPAVPDPLANNVANFFDQPAGGYTRRWQVAAGPTADTRRVTMRIIPPRAARPAKEVEVITILRQW